jgi:hypothetical protein
MIGEPNLEAVFKVKPFDVGRQERLDRNRRRSARGVVASKTHLKILFWNNNNLKLPSPGWLWLIMNTSFD